MLTAIVVVCAALATVAAVLFQDPGRFGRDKVLTDYDAFHIAGTMAAEGRAADTYRASETIAAQNARSDTPSFMPWTYPPPYTLVVQGLAQLPIAISYLIFITVSFAFYLLILRRIAGPYLPGVLIAILPTMLLIVRTGQNGFLTGGLIGWFLLALANGRRSAGVPLGLMVIKPHLAAGIALLALLGRRWTVMALAAAIVAFALAAPTVAFGAEIWPAFVGGVREAGQFLAAGYYQLFRMTSIYAWVRSCGAPPSLAIALHAAGAITAIALFLALWWKGHAPRVIAAAACAMSLFVSPYNYDYDLAILGVGIAFVLAELVEHGRLWELRALLALSWFTAGYGLAMDLIQESGSTAMATDLGADMYLSLAAPGLMLLIGGAWLILRRAAAVGSSGAAAV